VRWALELCGGLFRHILQALVFASQSPYSGLKNVVYLFALGEIQFEYCGYKEAKNPKFYLTKY
jgi:hypothetical protein